MTYDFITANKACWAVTTMCRVLKVSTSAYYASCTDQSSARRSEDQVLLQEIRRIHASSGGRYGAPRVYQEMRLRGYRTSEKRVARLMAAQELRGSQKGAKRRTPRTTTSLRGAETYRDHVRRDFRAAAPNRIWVADITFVRTAEGFLYLAVVLDVCTRRIVGYAMRQDLRTGLVVEALRMALDGRQSEGVIHHSDHGSQYLSHEFTALCAEAGITISMGRVGDCYDNAMCESFFATLENELLDSSSFETREDARLAIFSYIEGWYNHRRLHSSLGYRTPEEYESLYHQSTIKNTSF